ncbi:hypothetical protein ACRQ5Q_13380 [Bradyrhizobium sp. PMVTL-01]|uniref:hypothetical protein n=1 Tax=Bradyrhizobium sp. PMVTL-01 TaxID=3434999 RepID=UPI003F6F79EA
MRRELKPPPIDAVARCFPVSLDFKLLLKIFQQGRGAIAWQHIAYFGLHGALARIQPYSSSIASIDRASGVPVFISHVTQHQPDAETAFWIRRGRRICVL